MSWAAALAHVAWRWVDRSGWPAGEWDDEPHNYDRWWHGDVQCAIIRNRTSGVWCGYALIPADHPWSQQASDMGYDFPCLGGPFDSAEVHGGVTFAHRYDPSTGEGCEGLWVGFDCSHLYDRAPYVRDSAFIEPGSQYRSQAYARQQTEGLAQQIADGGQP